MNTTLFNLYIILGILTFFAIVLCVYCFFKSKFTKKYINKNVSTSPITSTRLDFTNSSNTDSYYNLS